MRNSNLFTHIKYDKNAIKHVGIGAAVGIPVAFIAWWLPTVAALLAGVAIEVYQRRTGGKNTMRESVMDTLTTGIGGVFVAAVMILWRGM